MILKSNPIHLHAANKDAVIEMKNELFIMEMVDNPFAVKLYLHYLVNETLYIFMQLADAGSFGKLLEKGGVLDEKESQFYFAQMICGVNHMHACNIAHRDIKVRRSALILYTIAINAFYIFSQLIS